jgi:thiol-disulfide isomerase/thioredoxin
MTTARPLLRRLLPLALVLLTATTALAQEPAPPADPTPPTDAQPQKPEEKKQKGWLGVGLQNLSGEEAKQRGYAHDLAKITEIFPGSPAETSGFLPDDIVLAIDGVEVHGTKQLVENIGARAAGDKVTVQILRGSQKVDAPLLLGIHPGKYGLLKSRFLDKPAPDFKFKRVDNDKDLGLSDLKGQVIVIDFWATWCGPCKKAIPRLNQMSQTFKNKGVTFVGLSDEDRQVLQKFKGKNAFDYMMAYDGDDAPTSKTYYVSALPTLFVIDHKGVVRDVHIGAGDLDALQTLVQTLADERAKDLKPAKKGGK